jgi:Calcineurin-like phosphoesterase
LKCVAVSDFHMHDVVTPPADLLIVAGDMTSTGAPSQLQWFQKWLEKQPQKHKVWIAGNHELGLEENPEWAHKIAQETGSVYLEDSPVVIEGLFLWGSPITPTFFDWAFMRDRGNAIRKHWNEIPEGLDILITHGPPFGYLDLTPRGIRAGCEELLDVLKRMASPPSVHIFGHIHAAYGRTTLKSNPGGAVELINASICDESYQPSHEPVVFELEPRRR